MRPTVIALLSFASAGWAAESYREKLMADQPVAYWTFDLQNQCCFRSESHDPIMAKPDGGVSGQTPGPRPPQFPSFTDENLAIDFTTKGVDPKELVVRIQDPGKDSVFDFTNGDTITVEAWVQCKEKLRDWQWVYIAGKGRTENPGVPRDNQNWGVRLLGDGKIARASFIFRTAGANAKFHRWNSNLGFVPGDDWHHVAMSYAFGKPDSIKAWIDGQPSVGVWDDGGPTTDPPVVDNDEVWIGSSVGVSKSNTFPGVIDEVAIYRTALSDERIKVHAARAGEAPKLIDGGPKAQNPAGLVFAKADAPKSAEAAKPKAPAKPDLPVPELRAADLPKGRAHVEILEFPLKGDVAAVETFGGNDSDPTGDGDTAAHDPTWAEVPPKRTADFSEPAFTLTALPQKYNAHGVRSDRSRPFLVRTAGVVTLPAGEQTLLLRSLGGARVALDGKVVLQNPVSRPMGGDTAAVPDQLELQLVKDMPLLPAGHREVKGTVTSDGQPHVLVVETWVGGKNVRPELGELSLWRQAGASWELVSVAGAQIPPDFGLFREAQEERLSALNAQGRRVPAEEAYWEMRHRLAREKAAPAAEPPAGPQASPVDRFITAKLVATKTEPAPLVGDAAFLRRVTLDTVGVIPSVGETTAFLADTSKDKRARAIDRLLADPRWADKWTSYWQDVLAENPNIVKGTLNNTGPFRWWLHEALEDNLPLDRFATELIGMEGSANYGDPAGFGIATQNDLPMAAKAQIVSEAFLAMEMKCARCHDAPAHIFEQGDLFSIAAMLQRAPLKVPGSSLAVAPGAKSRVVVSLKPGQIIEPHFPFASLPKEPLPGVIRGKGDSRETLAAVLTDPRNDRFARVMVNRLWKQFLGFGIVEPVEDWETSQPSHQELLQWLAHELITHNFDAKHVARLILNSDTYQRATRPDAMAAVNSSDRTFAAQARRRLTAEQLLDSLMLASGQDYDTEMLTFDPENKQSSKDQANFRRPRRAWEFTSLSNERDRPALAKPRAQIFTDVLTAFGWRESRPEPRSGRDHDANVLQPALLANGTVGALVTRAHDDSAFTALALRKQSPEDLVRALYVRILSREPSTEETERFTQLLGPGYGARLTGAPRAPHPLPETKAVSWASHLNPAATTAVLDAERRVKAGLSPSPQLESQWRDRFEDALWALMLSPEFVWVP